MSSVRAAIRAQFFGSASSSTYIDLHHCRVISPSLVDLPDSNNSVLTRIVDKVRAHYRSASTAHLLEAKDKSIITDHWLLSVPNTLRNSERDIVNYLAMVVAIDFRHWAEVPVDHFPPVALFGEEVKGFAGFYTPLVPSHSGDKEADASEALHAEKNNRSLLRGSAAMIHLLRSAVEDHCLPWYSPDYLGQFQTVAEAREALSVCFLGCREDGVTPLWMPATAERVELLLSLTQALNERGTDFFDMLVQSGGSLYSDDHSRGFIEQLVGLHERYHDVVPQYPTLTGGRRNGGEGGDEEDEALLPILKLSQLTALAIEQALPAFWRWTAATQEQDGEANNAVANVCQHSTAASAHGSNDEEVEEDADAWLNALRAKTSPTVFSDIAELSICCDYQIPKALRDAGLLLYDTHLSDCVDRGVLLRPTSPEEVTIRVGTLIAAEMLLDHLRDVLVKEGVDLGESGDVPVPVMDYALWYVGRYPSEGAISTRHHLCRTIMY